MGAQQMTNDGREIKKSHASLNDNDKNDRIVPQGVDKITSRCTGCKACHRSFA
jgi:ferredoxin